MNLQAPAMKLHDLPGETQSNTGTVFAGCKP